jgi:hypothetical protein
METVFRFAAHPIGQTGHPFVAWVMGKTDIISTHLMHLFEQGRMSSSLFARPVRYGASA